MKCFLCSRRTVLPAFKERGVTVAACWRHRNKGKIELQRRLAVSGRYQLRKRL